ncbi:MAG: hypothetical protein ACWA5Q_07155, partial [bacterium]
MKTVVLAERTGLLITGWVLLAYLIYAQAIPALDYELGIEMGTQEPASQITEVGVAFWQGFAVADLMIYIPLLAAGLVGIQRGRYWGKLLFSAAAGITVYWPVVALATVLAADGAEGWQLVDESLYWA